MIVMRKVFLLGYVILLMLLVGCGNGAKENEVEEVMLEAEAEPKEAELGLRFELPVGFVADESEVGLFVTEGYPDDISCILYQESEADERIELLTEEVIKEQTEAIYSEVYDIDTVVTVNDFHRFKRNDYQGLRIDTQFDLDGQMIRKLEYVIITEDKNHSLTFMQPADMFRYDEFVQCAETIQVRK